MVELAKTFVSNDLQFVNGKNVISFIFSGYWKISIVWSRKPDELRLEVELKNEVNRKNVREMRSCDLLLLVQAKQQVDFNCETTSSLLSKICTNVKSYRPEYYSKLRICH